MAGKPSGDVTIGPAFFQANIRLSLLCARRDKQSKLMLSPVGQLLADLLGEAAALGKKNSRAADRNCSETHYHVHRLPSGPETPGAPRSSHIYLNPHLVHKAQMRSNNKYSLTNCGLCAQMGNQKGRPCQIQCDSGGNSEQRFCQEQCQSASWLQPGYTAFLRRLAAPPILPIRL